MDPESSISQPRDYMHKEHSIRIDVANIQANVPHIFKKTKISRISDNFVKIYDQFDNGLESQSDVQYLIDNKLYEKYRFIFNNIPKNALYYYNNKEKESNYFESEDTTRSSNTDDSRFSGFKDQKLDLDSYVNCKIDDKSYHNVASIFQEWINVILSMSKVGNASTYVQDVKGPIIKNKYHLDSDIYEELSDSSATEFNSSIDSVFENVETKSNSTIYSYNGFKESFNKIDYKFIKKMSTILVGFISHMDDWKIRVEDSLSRVWTDRLTLDQARKLLDEFNEISSELILCDVSEKLDTEIRNTEVYSSRIREKLPCIFGDTKEKTSLDLSLVERFLKDGMETTFVTQEYLTLSQMFHSVSSLRHMLDQSVLESDFVKSDALIKEFDNTIIVLPHLEKLKTFITRSFWFDRAKKYSENAVHYKLICELVENTPTDLMNHKLYDTLRDKLSRTYEWIELVNESGLCSIVKNVNSKGDNNKNKDKGDVKECNRNEDNQISCKRSRSGDYVDKNPGQLEYKDNKDNNNVKTNVDPNGSSNINEDNNKDNTNKEKLDQNVDNKQKNNNVKDNENINVDKKQNKIRPKDIEYLYNSYHQLGVLVPIFKSVEHLYIIWKRFQRKYRKYLNLIRSPSCTNFTMEAMVLLQQSEQVTEYLDLSFILDPIIVDVEFSLSFERKFRQIMVKFNNWSITDLCVKFNTDWNTLSNLRKTASVNDNDLVEVINIMYIYQNYLRETLEKKNNNEQQSIDDSVPNNSKNNTNNNEVEQNDESCSSSSSKSVCDFLPFSRTPVSSSTSKSYNSGVNNSNISNRNSTSNNNNVRSISSGTDTTKMRDIGSKVEFSEIMELNEEFNGLKIKNWPIYRVLEEMYNTALHIKERAENIIKDINDGFRSDGLISNLILVTLDTLKFGAILNLDEKLLKTLKFCLWVKTLYSLFLKLYIIVNKLSKVNEQMGIEGNEGNNKNEIVLKIGKKGFEEPKEIYTGELDEVYQEFILCLRELSNQAIVEDYMDMLDEKIPIGFKLNIPITHKSNKSNKDSKSSLRTDGFKNMVDINKIFTLTEWDVVSLFTPS